MLMIKQPHLHIFSSSGVPNLWAMARLGTGPHSRRRAAGKIETFPYLVHGKIVFHEIGPLSCQKVWGPLLWFILTVTRLPFDKWGNLGGVRWLTQVTQSIKQESELGMPSPPLPKPFSWAPPSSFRPIGWGTVGCPHTPMALDSHPWDPTCPSGSLNFTQLPSPCLQLLPSLRGKLRTGGERSTLR